MSLIGYLARRSPTTIVAAAITSVLGGLASTRVITLVKEGLERDGGEASLGLGRFIGYCVVALLATVASQALLVRLSASSLRDLRLQMSRNILAAPYRQLEEIGAARLTAVLTTDVAAIATALTTVPSVITSATVLVACLGYLAFLSWQLFLALLVYAAAGTLLCVLPILAANRRIRLARAVQDRLYELYRAITEGAKELRLHRGRREALQSVGLEVAAEEYRGHTVAGGTIFELSAALGQTLLLAGLGVVLFVSPQMEGMSREATSGFALTLLFMATPLSYTFAMMRPLVGAAVAYRRVQALGLSLVVEPRVTVSPPRDRWTRLELRDVVATYRGQREDEKFCIGPVSTSFAPGEIVFVVGGNGSGKSTLIKVLVGLYAAESGTIAIDGHVVDDANRDWYRQHFSAVFADFFLFRDLPPLGTPEMEARIAEYLELLQMSHKVSVVDGRLSTIDLSQGQKKRLALLGAYLEDRPIYVFDEWAADQDPVFKDLFYTRLLPELRGRGKCVIVVSHDDRYFDVADRIIKMETGRIASETRGASAPSPASIAL